MGCRESRRSGAESRAVREHCVVKFGSGVPLGLSARYREVTAQDEWNIFLWCAVVK